VSCTILQRIAAGDQSAVKECMDVYGGLVWSLARRMSESAADAEDATQEVFLEVWRSAGRYQPAMGSEAVFLTTIARRRLIDRLRSRKRRPLTETYDELTEQAPEGPSEPAGALLADAERAHRALARLDAAQREVLLLGIVEGLTHAEIATATGRPLGTVKTQMRRGLMRVRELMEQGEPGPRTVER
jgi:RNA polymerase sigma factor (sigma-70 family)